MRHQCEIWVVYMPCERLGRRVFMGSENKETVLLSTPAARDSMPPKRRRGVGRQAGEQTTHDASYTGVAPVLPWSGLPMVSAREKENILGHPIALAPSRGPFTDRGHVVRAPLFWAERKSSEFWKTLYEDLGARAVVDVTPGTGLAARAALEMSLPYFGMARNSFHAQWLNMRANRAALQIAPGVCFCSTELAQQDDEHFEDVLVANGRADASLVLDTDPGQHM